MNTKPRNIDDFDLNLLRVLNVLLREGSVTKASQQLNLSQPAMSNALNRLRQQLNDPVVVRVGNRMVPTPKALSLAEPVGESLRLIQQTLQGRAFNPATLEVQARLLATDYVSGVLLPPLTRRLRSLAPGVSLAVISPSEAGSSAMLGEGKCDIALAGPSAELHDSLKQQKLFDEEFVCIARRKHPLLKKGLTLDVYCEAEHVMASPRGGGFSSPLDDALASAGRKRKVCLSVSQFLLGPRLVSQSDMLMTAGKRLADSFAKELDLVVYPLPFKAPGFRIVQAWHMRLDRDPMQKWLRAQIHECAKEI